MIRPWPGRWACPREVLRNRSRQDEANRDEHDDRAMTATDSETQRLCEQIAKLERIYAALLAKSAFSPRSSNNADVCSLNGEQVCGQVGHAAPLRVGDGGPTFP